LFGTLLFCDTSLIGALGSSLFLSGICCFRGLSPFLGSLEGKGLASFSLLLSLLGGLSRGSLLFLGDALLLGLLLLGDALLFCLLGRLGLSLGLGSCSLGSTIVLRLLLRWFRSLFGKLDLGKANLGRGDGWQFRRRGLLLCGLTLHLRGEALLEEYLSKYKVIIGGLLLGLRGLHLLGGGRSWRLLRRRWRRDLLSLGLRRLDLGQTDLGKAHCRSFGLRSRRGGQLLGWLRRRLNVRCLGRRRELLGQGIGYLPGHILNNLLRDADDIPHRLLYLLHGLIDGTLDRFLDGLFSINDGLLGTLNDPSRRGLDLLHGFGHLLLNAVLHPSGRGLDLLHGLIDLVLDCRGNLVGDSLDLPLGLLDGIDGLLLDRVANELGQTAERTSDDLAKESLLGRSSRVGGSTEEGGADGRGDGRVDAGQVQVVPQDVDGEAGTTTEDGTADRRGDGIGLDLFRSRLGWLGGNGLLLGLVISSAATTTKGIGQTDLGQFQLGHLHLGYLRGRGRLGLCLLFVLIIAAQGKGGTPPLFGLRRCLLGRFRRLLRRLGRIWAEPGNPQPLCRTIRLILGLQQRLLGLLDDVGRTGGDFGGTLEELLLLVVALLRHAQRHGSAGGGDGAGSSRLTILDCGHAVPSRAGTVEGIGTAQEDGADGQQHRRLGDVEGAHLLLYRYSK